MIEKGHVPLGPGLESLAACAVRASVLLAQRRVHQPRGHVGQRCAFADGTTGVVYRETVVDGPAPTSPAVLVVSFQLRHVRTARAHALFRLESELNTVLFVGFPGFVSKLWLRHDERGVYRGLYDWDGPALAEQYVQALWWALRVVSVPESIHYAVLPGLRRDDLLANPALADGRAPEEAAAWWRLVSGGARVA